MGSENECQLLTFLGNLKGDDPDELSRITALLSMVADHGLPKNDEKCRYFPELKAFELKSRGGVRIMAFWDDNRIIICSHGFLKKSQKTPKEELRRLETSKAAYFTAKRENRLVWPKEGNAS